jgi:hypothetical protein
MYRSPRRVISDRGSVFTAKAFVIWRILPLVRVPAYLKFGTTPTIDRIGWANKLYVNSNTAQANMESDRIQNKDLMIIERYLNNA